MSGYFMWSKDGEMLQGEIDIHHGFYQFIEQNESGQM